MKDQLPREKKKPCADKMHSQVKGARHGQARERLRQRRLARWRRRFFKHLPPVTLVLLFFCSALGIGFVYFSETIYRLQVPRPLPKADGIIVLTGGRARLESGLKLLEEGKGSRLLISGVNPIADRTALVRATHADPKLFECCVDLGREALNTVGNANESADWVAKNHYKTVYVVTNDYHMPRSLLLLKRTLPNTTLIAYPINQSAGQDESWLQFFDRLRVIGTEYLKFIGVKLNIVAFFQ